MDTHPLVNLAYRWQMEHKLNDRAMAERLGLSWPAWSRLRRGQRQMSIKTLCAIARQVPGSEWAIMSWLKKGEV
jgi:transcriptional regulator with XRE-family HTH domain